MAHHGNNHTNRVGYVFDYNIIRGINKAREMSNKSVEILAKIKGSDTHVYNYDCYERLFNLKHYIKAIDDSVMALASCSIALDANTAIFEMLDLMAQKDELIREYQIRIVNFRKLPELDRRLLFLKFGKRISIKAISEITNLSMRTVIRHLQPYGISKQLTTKEQLDKVIITIPSDFTIKCCEVAA